MSSVKANFIKIKVLAALILKHNWRSMNWWIIVSNGRVSEEEHYISGSPAAISLWSASTTIKIGCHYSPQSLSTAAIRIHHQLPPRSWSTTTITNTIKDPPLRSLIYDPQIIINDVAAATVLDLRTIRQRDSGEEFKTVTCIDEIWISFMWSGWRRGRRRWEEKLWVSCVPRPSRPIAA